MLLNVLDNRQGQRSLVVCVTLASFFGGAALVVVAIGFAPPVSKRLFYYLTMTYNDPEGKKQSAVFELGKNLVRPMLKILEARSGQAIRFEDATTCRQYNTPNECEGK